MAERHRLLDDKVADAAVLVVVDVLRQRRREQESAGREEKVSALDGGGGLAGRERAGSRSRLNGTHRAADARRGDLDQDVVGPDGLELSVGVERVVDPAKGGGRGGAGQGRRFSGACGPNWQDALGRGASSGLARGNEGEVTTSPSLFARASLLLRDSQPARLHALWSQGDGGEKERRRRAEEGGKQWGEL